LKYIQIGEKTIGIDEYRTQLFYDKKDVVNKKCPCDYCQNYVYCCNRFPSELNKLFKELCINPEKANEVMEFFEDSRKKHLYASFYLIVGKVIKMIPENETIIDLTNEVSRLKKQNIIFDVSDVIFIKTNQKISPLIQVYLEISLPWVL